MTSTLVLRGLHQQRLGISVIDWQIVGRRQPSLGIHLFGSPPMTAFMTNRPAARLGRSYVINKLLKRLET
jgi:hypothetical protein